MSVIGNTGMASSMWAGQGGPEGSNREDLLDYIVICSPAETPFLSGFRKEPADGIRHETSLDSLVTFGDPDVGNSDVHATAEGTDATFTTPVNRKRISNLSHIFRRTVDVTETQRAVMTAGIEDELSYQIRKSLVELARLIEFALTHSEMATQAVVGNVGGSPVVARKMEGILAYLEPDPAGVSADYLDPDEEGTITEAGSPAAILTEDIFNNHGQTAYGKGVTFRNVYVNSVQKRAISSFTANVQREVQAASRRMISAIDYYDGDFGSMAVMLHRYMPTRVVLTLDDDYWNIAVLRPITATELAKTGDSDKVMLQAELTLSPKAPCTGGKITQCSSSHGSLT